MLRSGAQVMTGVVTLAGASLLLGAAMLGGCAYDPDAGPRAEGQAQRTEPTPGTVVVHMNGSVAAAVSVGR